MTAGRRVYAALAAVACVLASCGGGDHRAERDARTERRSAAPPAFLLGVNVPWNGFATDIGCGYDPGWFDRTFARLADAGVNTVRFWVHADGRCSPVFSADGTPEGLPPAAIGDLEQLLDAADRHGLGVVVVLFSHDMVTSRADQPFPAGHHDDLLRSPEKTAAYVDTVLTPMLAAVGTHPAVRLWEIVNEPELMVDGVSDDPNRTTVPKADVQRFVGTIAAAVNRATDVPVTVGALNVESLVASTAPLAAQWWTDKALVAATGDPDATLDVYEVHYFDYMETTSPWDVDLPQRLADQGKPVLIGEMPLDIARGLERSVVDARTMGYWGVLGWAFNDDCCGSWDTAEPTFRALASRLGG